MMHGQKNIKLRNTFSIITQSFLLCTFSLFLYDRNIQLNYFDYSLLNKFRNLFIEGPQIWPRKFWQLPVWLSSLKNFSTWKTYKNYDMNIFYSSCFVIVQAPFQFKGYCGVLGTCSQNLTTQICNVPKCTEFQLRIWSCTDHRVYFSAFPFSCFIMQFTRQPKFTRGKVVAYDYSQLKFVFHKLFIKSNVIFQPLVSGEERTTVCSPPAYCTAAYRE